MTDSSINNATQTIDIGADTHEIVMRKCSSTEEARVFAPSQPGPQKPKNLSKVAIPALPAASLEVAAGSSPSESSILAAFLNTDRLESRDPTDISTSSTPVPRGMADNFSRNH